MKRLSFSDPMYLAFLAGRKAQTRRVIHPQPGQNDSFSHGNGWRFYFFHPNDLTDYLTVRPAYLPGEIVAIAANLVRGPDNSIRYRANGELASVKSWQWENKTLAARFCPLWCCQHTARIVSVRVERVRFISEEDAEAEGVTPSMCPPYNDIVYRAAYMSLWDVLHTKPGELWENNPWVFVYEFVKVS